MITAGEVLKNKRESLGKNLNTVSAETRIQKRFLEYIESDQYQKFDSEVFASGFIKIYSKYLGLDVEKVLAVYRRSNLNNVKKVTESIPKNNKRKKFKLNVTPQLIAIVALILFLTGVIGYIGYQIYKFQTPPQLSVIEPTDELETDSEKITVKGSTDTGSSVSINGLPTQIDSVGYFEKEITLTQGVNSITVISKKNSNNNLETTKTLKVVYKSSEEQTVQPEEQQKEYIAILKISNSSAWIKLDIDGENKISQILEPNTQRDFQITEILTLVTGRISSTSLEINGEKVEITPSQNSGVGQITCQITQNSYECK